MLKRLPLVATIGAVLLLTACGPVAGPTASPTDTSSPSASASPTTAPTGGPTSAPTVLTAGDCTQAEAPEPTPTIYTVYTDDSTKPVTIHYSAFNHDGSTPVETLTTVGPVITIIGYDCSNPSEGDVWTLTATHPTIGSIGCVLSFGGMLVNSQSDGQEDAGVTVDCSGNPGI